MESVQQLDPSKYHVLTPRGRIFLVIALVLFVLVVMPIAIVAYYTFAINRPSQTADEVTYEVKSGASGKISWRANKTLSAPPNLFTRS